MTDLLALPLGTPAPLPAIDRQKRWEVEGVNRAIRRFREIEADRSLEQRTAGRSALRDVAPRLVARIKSAQAEAMDGIANAGRGRPVPWWWYVGLLPPDQLAVLTAVTALTGVGRVAMTGDGKKATLGDGANGAPLLKLSLAVASAVKLQAEFGQWVDSERAKESDAKKKEQTYRNLHEALRRNAKKIDERAVKTWWRRIDKLRSEDWPKPDCIHLGTALLTWLVEAGGGWFEIVLLPLAGGKTQRVVRLTDLARRAMEDITNRAESAQAYTMPMLCPPIPWSYEPNGNTD